ncbi:hypothetical protein JCM10908_000587 [Rhodotorula pacifica]|uniref:tethering complex subunit VPS16 n=1 Tax=Rhodotorula pacifica TaxID=1495444 RepID=UPI0031816523
MVASAMSVSATWQPVGDQFYRLDRVYSLQDSHLANLDLTDYTIASAPHAGPIALTRDHSKPVLLGKYSHASAANNVSIYSQAGNLIQTIAWDAPTPIVHLSFTASEALVILTASGQYRLYQLSTHPTLPPTYTQHAIPNLEENGLRVRQAKAYPGGFVALLEDGSFVEVRIPASASRGGESLAGGEGNDSYGLGSKGKRRAASDEDAPSGKERRTIPLAATGLDAGSAIPDCWCILPPDPTSTHTLEVLFAKGETVFRLDEIDCVDQRLTRGPYRSITPSPNGRFLSLLTVPPSSSSASSSSSPNPILWVSSSDFSRSLSEFIITPEVSEGERGIPRMVEWCGSNSVVLGWERTVVMVGPFGETLKFFYADPIHLVTEVDGTRIIGAEASEFLQIVPASAQKIYLPGSTSPAALLFEASTQFYEHKSPRADEYVRSLGKGPEMAEAIEGCLDAAVREWEEREQKRLLKAAAFGKSFLDAYSPSEFVEATRTLRVLNAVRDYKIGLPLTWDQYHSRPPAHLISRLVNRSQHLLALRISAFLGLSPSPVIRHWAQQLIAASAPGVVAVGAGTGAAGPQSDEEVCRAIVDNLRSLSVASPASSSSSATGLAGGAAAAPGSSNGSASAVQDVPLSSADIALTAFRLGRRQLARLLIDREPRASKQVPLLLRMEEGEEACRKAVQSGDPDLVFQALLHLRRTLSPGDLFMLVERIAAPAGPIRPAAAAGTSSSTSGAANSTSFSTSGGGRRAGDALRLLEVFAREMGEMQLLRDYWYQDDRRVEMALEALRESGTEKDYGEKVAKARQAQKSFADEKERSFEAKMVHDQVRLLVLQQQLEQESTVAGRTFVGLSVNETIRQCLLVGLEKKADKARSDFKVPDKRFWYLKLRALIALRDWDALDTFARSKKSPIGYEPWVDELIRAGAQRQAVRYVDRCDPRNRVELYIKCGEWVMAGQECARRGERGRLQELKSRAPNKIIAAQLEELAADLNNAS